MSRENVELVRRAIDAFNRRDLDEFLQCLNPEAELDWSRSLGVEAGVYRGRQAIRDFSNTFLETWEEVTTSVDEFIECGESVVVPGRTHFRGRDGIDVQAYGAFVYTVRDARIVELRVFDERSEALKAVG